MRPFPRGGGGFKTHDSGRSGKTRANIARSGVVGFSPENFSNFVGIKPYGPRVLSHDFSIIDWVPVGANSVSVGVSWAPPRAPREKKLCTGHQDPWPHNSSWVALIAPAIGFISKSAQPPIGGGGGGDPQMVAFIASGQMTSSLCVGPDFQAAIRHP